MFLVILIIASIYIYTRARSAQLNTTAWVIYNVLAMCAALFLGAMISVFILLIKDRELIRLIEENPGNQQVLQDYLMKGNIWLTEVFLTFAAIGGFLFIHYRLQRISGTTNTGG